MDINDADRLIITRVIDNLSYGILHDRGHVASNRKQVLRLYATSSLSLGEFLGAMREAYSIIIPKLPQLRNRAAYYFAVLRDILARYSVGLSAREAEYWLCGIGDNSRKLLGGDA